VSATGLRWLGRRCPHRQRRPVHTWRLNRGVSLIDVSVPAYGGCGPVATTLRITAEGMQLSPVGRGSRALLLELADGVLNLIESSEYLVDVLTEMSLCFPQLRDPRPHLRQVAVLRDSDLLHVPRLQDADFAGSNTP
jgi:hypothetical protein